MQTRSNPFERDAVRPPKRQRCQGFTSCYEDPLFEGSLVPSISTTERPNGFYVPPEISRVSTWWRHTFHDDGPGPDTPTHRHTDTATVERRASSVERRASSVERRGRDL